YAARIEMIIESATRRKSYEPAKSIFDPLILRPLPRHWLFFSTGIDAEEMNDSARLLTAAPGSSDNTPTILELSLTLLNSLRYTRNNYKAIAANNAPITLTETLCGLV